MLLRLPVNSRYPEEDAIHAAVTHIHNGQVVAYPTDTLYGLAVDPRDAHAAAALFQLKGRSPDVPVPLILADTAQLKPEVAQLTPLGEKLASRFWPGPLTIVLNAGRSIVPAVHAGTATIAVRVPAHPVARALAAAAGHPITATSANRSGHAAAATADDVNAAFASSDLVLLDAGALPRSTPSTIIDARGTRPVLVRAGAVPWDRVLEFLES